MEGYHDREFGKEPKWIIKTGECGPKHELNLKYGQPLTEQQVTEEQLHNLNEAIKGLCMDGCERMADSLHSLYNILRRNKEQKPVTNDRQQECPYKDLALVKNFFGEYKRKCKLSNKACDSKECEQWSEEDKTNGWTGVDLERYLSCLQRLGTGNSQQPETINSKWFKEHCHPQPKQEWSEEDEEMRNLAIEWAETMSGQFRFVDMDSTDFRKIIVWLKSLRPSWKPSEEQIGALDYAYCELFKKEDVGHNILGPFQKLCDELKKLGVKEESEYYQHFDPDC